LEGETLLERLGKGSLPLEQTLRFGVEIADALDKAHRQGIVHRDLKPGNVMLTKSGVKLLDFGLAKFQAGAREAALSGVSRLATEAQASQPLTERGTVLGTFQYMAPEQLEGKEADGRSDIFAFGAVLYEMATGRKAFTGKSQASLIGAILRDDPPAISEVSPMTPPALNRVVKTCLAKDPEDRWQSAHDVAGELKWIAEGSAAGLAVPAIVASKRRSRERAAWLLAAVATLAAAVLALRGGRRPSQDSALLVSSLLMPQGLQINEIDRSLALSPDGSRLAIAGTGGTGGGRLWLRSLEGREVRPLPGTEDATYPFWSPDGRSLGFFASHKLKKLDVGTGSVTTICAASEGRGATWGPDATIIFAPTVLGPLARVSAAGGEPVAITKVERPEETDRLPHFLPDGRRVLFVRGSSDSIEAKIWLLDLDSGKASVLASESSEAVFAPPGYLLFRRGRRLMAQPFDPASARLKGTPALLADSVNFYAGRYAGQFTVSGTGLLVYEGEQVLVQSRLTWFDAEGNRLGTVGEPRAINDLRISHDGKTAAVVALDPSSRNDIWLFDLQRGGARRFTFEREGAEEPAWSPDDREIAYVVGNGGITFKPVGEGQARRVSRVSADIGRLSPDGSLLSVFPPGEAGTFGLGVIPRRGDGPVRNIVGSRVQRGTGWFSPDGKWLGYISDESGRDELYVVPSSGSGGKWQVSSNGVIWATWPARSGEILFTEPPEGRLLAVEFRVRDGNIEVATPRPLFGGRPLPLSTALDVTHDGKRILLAIPAEQGSHALTLVANWPALLRNP
ncbi:MAG: protein kinase domain-containing protein, partial [Thermoanaerobaculia bacterium]